MNPRRASLYSFTDKLSLIQVARIQKICGSWQKGHAVPSVGSGHGPESSAALLKGVETWSILTGLSCPNLALFFWPAKKT